MVKKKLFLFFFRIIWNFVRGAGLLDRLGFSKYVMDNSWIFPYTIRVILMGVFRTPLNRSIPCVKHWVLIHGNYAILIIHRILEKMRAKQKNFIIWDRVRRILMA